MRLFYVTDPAWHGEKIFFCFYEVWRNEKWFMWQLLTLWKLIIYNNVSFPNPTFQQIKSFPKHIFRIWCLSLCRWNAEFGILWREILTILKWINKYKLTISGWRYAEERMFSQNQKVTNKKINIFLKIHFIIKPMLLFWFPFPVCIASIYFNCPIPFFPIVFICINICSML